VNRKKNEQKLINNFKKIFGKPEDVIICGGDYEQKNPKPYKSGNILVHGRHIVKTAMLYGIKM